MKQIKVSNFLFFLPDNRSLFVSKGQDNVAGDLLRSCLREFIAFAEDWGPVPSVHTAARHHP